MNIWKYTSKCKYSKMIGANETGETTIIILSDSEQPLDAIEALGEFADRLTTTIHKTDCVGG